MNLRQKRVVHHQDGESDDKGCSMVFLTKGSLVAIITTANRTTGLLSAEENNNFIQSKLDYLEFPRPRYLLGADLGLEHDEIPLPKVPADRIDAIIEMLDRENIDEWADTAPQMVLYEVGLRRPDLLKKMDLIYYEGTANVTKTLQYLYNHHRDVIISNAGGLEGIRNSILSLAKEKGKDFSTAIMSEKFLVECAIRMHYYGAFHSAFKSALPITPYIEGDLFDDNAWMTNFDKEFYPETCQQLAIFYDLQKKIIDYDEEIFHEEVNKKVLAKQCRKMEELLLAGDEKLDSSVLDAFKKENVSDEELIEHRKALKESYSSLKEIMARNEKLSPLQKNDFQANLDRALRISGVCKSQRLIADILVSLNCVRQCCGPASYCFDLVRMLKLSKTGELELGRFNLFSVDPLGNIQRLTKKLGLHREIDEEFSGCLKEMNRKLRLHSSQASTQETGVFSRVHSKRSTSKRSAEQSVGDSLKGEGSANKKPTLTHS
ncbi:MAG: hypothetical protein K0S27_1437 [Gammaproteobacteria bacterium]|jgi:hypothetical protein|nr:hypothetical protein [Gammaproteobacteria bacterium]